MARLVSAGAETVICIGSMPRPVEKPDELVITLEPGKKHLVCRQHGHIKQERSFSADIMLAGEGGWHRELAGTAVVCISPCTWVQYTFDLSRFTKPFNFRIDNLEIQ